MSSSQNRTLKEQTDALEKLLTIRALIKAGGIQKFAASRLGVTPRSVWYLLKKHDLYKFNDGLLKRNGLYGELVNDFRGRHRPPKN